MPKLHKALPAFRGITACCGTTTEDIAKIIHAILVGIRPALHALWRRESMRIDITTDECSISSGGIDIVEMMKEADRKAFVRGVE